MAVSTPSGLAQGGRHTPLKQIVISTASLLRVDWRATVRDVERHPVRTPYRRRNGVPRRSRLSHSPDRSGAVCGGALSAASAICRAGSGAALEAPAPVAGLDDLAASAGPPSGEPSGGGGEAERVSRSSGAVVIRAAPKTLGDSTKARLAVTMIAVCAQRRPMRRGAYQVSRCSTHRSPPRTPPNPLIIGTMRGPRRGCGAVSGGVTSVNPCIRGRRPGGSGGSRDRTSRRAIVAT